MANYKHSGITEATTNPERQFPSKRTTTKITIKQPKIKFSATVKVVLPTNVPITIINSPKDFARGF